MTEHIIAGEGDIPEGGRILVEVEGREVAVFNRNGEYYAYANWCPHQGGPICEGELSGTLEASFDRETLTVDRDWVAEGTVLTCPWHGWEFDVTSGECRVDDTRLPTYSVRVEDGDVVITL